MDGSRHPTRGLTARDAAVAVALVAGYELGALWGREFETMPGFTPWFPPPGITMVVLLAFGLRFIPVVFVAELISSLLIFEVQETFTTAQLLLNAAAITVGYGGAAWLLVAMLRIRPDLKGGRDLAWLVGLGVIAAPLLVALAGTAIRIWAEGGDWSGYLDSVRTWAIGDALGVVSVTPAALVISAWWRHRVPDMIRREFLNVETLAQAVVVVGMPFLMLAVGEGRGSALVLSVVPLVWVALRRSFEVTVGSLFVITAATTIAAKLELGGGVDRADTQLSLLLFAIVALAVGWAVREQRRSTARLERRALSDPVTGLPNRAAFVQALRTMLWGEQHCTLLYLDLDRLKLVRDSLGHEQGDRLLAAASRRLRGALGDDTLLARFGGGEFTVLVRSDGDDGTAALETADTILAALESPLDVDGKRISTSASIGVAHARGRDPGSLLRHGDIAMQEAKRARDGSVAVFDTEMAARTERRAQIEQGLRASLELDDLEVVYQPIVSLTDGCPAFAEALLRWKLDGAAVPAGEFIPVAEDTGLIVPLGRRALAAACREAARWSSGAAVSVNVSPVQLRAPGFADQVLRILSDTALPAERLMLELTEGALVEDEAVVIGVLEQLRSAGIRVALDDFGTGYSSLAYLEGIPVDVLKLDMAFVARLGTSERAEGVLSAAIELAHALGLQVVAEGVETSRQAHILFLLGCDLGQGYLFAGPGAADEVLARVSARERPSGTFVVRTAEELAP